MRQADVESGYLFGKIVLPPRSARDVLRAVWVFRFVYRWRLWSTSMLAAPRRPNPVNSQKENQE